MKITVYHGATETIKTPVAEAGRPNLDFGRGFYVTDIRQQAIDWAKKVADKRKETAVLNVYSLDRDIILSHFRYKVFEHYDGEWLDFIVASRIGMEPWKEYDYIEGGIANDRVVDTINLYIADLITREKALERLSEHSPNNQMCLINQQVIDKHLEYDRTEQIH